MKHRPLWLLVGGTLISAILVVVLVYATTEPYEAHAMLRVVPRPADMLPSMYPVYDRREFDEFKNSMLGRVTDPFVINAALRDPEIANCSILQNVKYKDLWLQEHLSVSLSDDFIRISLCGDNPHDLAAIVNAVTAAFEQEVIEEQQQERRRELDELRQIAFDSHARLEDLKNQLNQLNRQVTAASNMSLVNAPFENRLRETESARRVELMEKESRLEYLNSLEDGTASDTILELTSEVAQLRAVLMRFEEAKLESRIPAVNLVEREVLKKEAENLEEKVQLMDDRIFWFEIALERHPDQVRVYYQADVPRRKNRWERILRRLKLGADTAGRTW